MPSAHPLSPLLARILRELRPRVGPVVGSALAVGCGAPTTGAVHYGYPPKFASEVGEATVRAFVAGRRARLERMPGLDGP